MRFSRQQLSIGFVLILLAAALGLMLLGLFDPQGRRSTSFFGPDERPWPPPLEAEIIVPARSPVATLPKGVEVGPNGFGTLLSAPPMPAERLPSPGDAAPAGPIPASAVAPEVAGLIRAFARAKPLPPREGLINFHPVAPPLQTATIILREGCLRLNQPGEPLALFSAFTYLFVEDGYLTIGHPRAPPQNKARVGEPILWEGERKPVRDPAIVDALRGHCGSGEVVLVGPIQNLPIAKAVADAQAARQFATMYGVPLEAALRQARACRQRMEENWRRENPDKPLPAFVDAICGSTPPRPVEDPADCPAGTSLSGGLCRTPEGHVRPVPPM